MKNKIRDIVTISNQEGKEEDYLVEVYFAIEKCRKMQSKMQSFATLLIPF